jgi:putative Mg2+ transporter-C (MgtC) family protein
MLSSSMTTVPPALAASVSISQGEIVLRLGLSMLLCAIIGLERSARDEVAGLRTHALVGLGAALFSILSAYGFADVTTRVGTQLDPTRIAAQIVSGIGFLGAGAIIRQGVNVRGVTTASSLWIVAAIGMAIGTGFYVAAIVTTALALFALIGLRRFRAALMPSIRTGFAVLDVELAGEGQSANVLAVLARHRIRIEAMQSDLAPDSERLHFELRLPPRLDFAPVLAELRRVEDVAAASCSELRS